MGENKRKNACAIPRNKENCDNNLSCKIIENDIEKQICLFTFLHNKSFSSNINECRIYFASLAFE